MATKKELIFFCKSLTKNIMQNLVLDYDSLQLKPVGDKKGVRWVGQKRINI